jgi:hypothetical protein
LSPSFVMVELRGQSLLGAVTVLTSLGFLLIGFDNGLMGGLGECYIEKRVDSHTIVLIKPS